MSSEHRARTKALIVAAALVVAALVVLGVLRAVTSSSGTSTPESCEGGTKARSSMECRQALLLDALDTAGSSALDGVSDAKRVAVAKALCAQADDLLGDESAPPIRGDVESKVAKAARVSAAAVAAVMDSLDRFCPTEARSLQGLTLTRGMPVVELTVDGSGPIEVTYTATDGSRAKESGFAPWKLPIRYPQPVAIHLEAAPRDLGTEAGAKTSSLRCAIQVGSTTVTKAGPSPKGDTVTCQVSSEQAVAAANRPTSQEPG